MLAVGFFNNLRDWSLEWSGVATLIFMGAMIFFFWRTLKLMPKTKPVQIKPAARSEIGWDEIAGCEECLKIGSGWVHLRMCMTCGKIGCCDSSPNKHATAHGRESGHPIIRSAEPGEDWSWCYLDEVAFKLAPQ